MNLKELTTLYVVAAQAPPSANGGPCASSPKELGDFRKDGRRNTMFMCCDGWRLRNDADYRAKVASRIVDGTREDFRHITSVVVLVHKTDSQFVYGMVGLADELIKLHGYDVKVAYATDSGNGKSARWAVLECMQNILRSTPLDKLPPMAVGFEPSKLIDFNTSINSGDSAQL